MPWLVRDGEVLATVEVAEGTMARVKGLLGRDSLDGAFLIRPGRSIHTVGMRFPIDVAFCDGELRVVAVVCGMGRHRVGRPRWRARAVIEAESGAFDRWRLKPGDRLEIKAP